MNTELSYETCLELLTRGSVGRVAVCTPNGPRILPVNYSVFEESIVFRTAPYSVLGTYGWNTRIAFEVDQLDHEYQTAWSVVALGRADMIEDGNELAEIRTLRNPRPWAGEPRLLYIRLRWDELTGRQIGAGWPQDEKPMRRSV